MIGFDNSAGDGLLKTRDQIVIFVAFHDARSLIFRVECCANIDVSRWHRLECGECLVEQVHELLVLWRLLERISNLLFQHVVVGRELAERLGYIDYSLDAVAFLF
jgi:transcription elongation factor GreA-like protein